MKPAEHIIEWEQWDISERHGTGHGIELHDPKRGESGQDTLVGYIEGYSYDHAIHCGYYKIPLKGYFIIPDQITSQDVIDEMKISIEKVMKHHLPKYNEKITDRIIESNNC